MKKKSAKSSLNLEDARKLLGLGEEATLNDIRQSYRAALKRWHPDTCRENKALCQKRSEEIIKAYQVLSNFCENYPLPLREEGRAEQKGAETEEEWWKRRFGDDPVWH